MFQRTTRGLAMFISLVSVSLFFFHGPTRVNAACEGKCRNADFLGNNFWHIVRNTNNSMTLFINGSPAGSQPGGTTSNNPALRVYNNQVSLAVRGTDPNQGVWVNRWTGTSWTGWFNLQMGTTTNSPDMTVFNNALYLIVAGTDPFQAIWRNRFTTFWSGWSSIGSGFVSAQTCSSGSTIRAGGCKQNPSSCVRHTSTNGNTWAGPFAGNPCP